MPGFLHRSARRIESVLIPGAALVGALAAFGLFVALPASDPLESVFLMYRGAFGTWFSCRTPCSGRRR